MASWRPMPLYGHPSNKYKHPASPRLVSDKPDCGCRTKTGIKPIRSEKE